MQRSVVDDDSSAADRTPHTRAKMPDEASLMDNKDFEGTVVLERLAAIGELDAFFDAIDADDVRRAVALMRRAGVDADTIATVVEKMEDADGEH